MPWLYSKYLHLTLTDHLRSSVAKIIWFWSWPEIKGGLDCCAPAGALDKYQGIWTLMRRIVNCCTICWVYILVNVVNQSTRIHKWAYIVSERLQVRYSRLEKKLTLRSFTCKYIICNLFWMDNNIGVEVWLHHWAY